MFKTGMNAKGISSINRGLILQYLATADHLLTRAELTSLTGLSKMTVSNIVNEFLATNLLQESIGRGAPLSRSNPALLEISPSAPKLLGIRIRHHSCVATLCDFHLNILSTNTIAADLEKLSSSDDLLDILYRLIEPFSSANPIMAIGIGSIGPIVDPVTGTAQYEFFSDPVPLRSSIEARFHIPVYLEHTSNCSILAEQIYGFAKNYHDFAQLSMASSFSLGVVLNDHLPKSLIGFSQGISHMCIDPNGPQCYCGNRGCLETFTSVKIVQQAVARSSLIQREMTFAEICENSDNPAIHQILIHNLMDHLVIAMTNAAQLLNPEVFFVADELIRLPDRYLAYLEQALNNRIISRNYRYIKVLRPKISTENNAAFCAISAAVHFFRNGFPED